MAVVIAQSQDDTRSRSDPRRRMIASAALLLREQGLTGTSLGDVLEHSGAPRGSIYHHFPGGKVELVEAAVGSAGRFIEATLERAARSGDPVAALHLFTAAWRQTLEASDFRAGCPIVAVAVEAQDDAPQLAAAAAAVFEAWRAVLVRLLVSSGVAHRRADTIATTMVAAIEGAIVLCRARRDAQPLDDVGRELERLVRAAMPAA